MSSSVHVDKKGKDNLILGEGPTVFCLLMLQKIYLFKAKDSEIRYYTMCFGNVSKDFTINNMKFLFILILLIITILLISINT